MKRLYRPKRSKLKLVAIIVAFYIILHVTRVIDYFNQQNYFTDFSYPSDVNLTKLTAQLLANREPDVPPSNPFNYRLLLNCQTKCVSSTEKQVHLLFVVKSAIQNYQNRMAIRQTWGSETRFGPSGIVIKRLFLLALLPPDGVDPEEYREYQAQIQKEQERYDDLVQGDFIDVYYNNTLKTIMGLKWVHDYCAHAQFAFFVDDDFYVSPKNVLRLLKHPNTYPEVPEGEPEVPKNQEAPFPTALSDQRLYTGFLFFVLPVRFIFHKLHVSLEEWPMNVFPPFINAGAFLISRKSLFEFYYASMYTIPMKLDDVYVGILAKKIGVEPTHNRYFFPFKVASSDTTYANLIATHGYRDPDSLINVWKQQMIYGNV